MATWLVVFCFGFLSAGSVAFLGGGGGTRPSLSLKAATQLEWRPEGEEYWEWDDGVTTHSIHYVRREPPTPKKGTVLLVHGFGASWFHWRFNVLPLVERGYAVYCVDLLGFGLSDKPVLDYSADTWSRQLEAFVGSVVKEPVVVAGNSLGGYVGLAAVADAPDKFQGLVLLNSAGAFRPLTPQEPQKEEEQPLNIFAKLFQKIAFRLSFEVVKRPQRIEQILKSVYPVDSSNVDEDLVESIAMPARGPRAADVYPLVITRPGGKGRPIDDLVQHLQDQPVLLVWGTEDPWIRPAAADKFEAVYRQARTDNDRQVLIDRVDVNAGHCVHDEVPHATNDAILNWLDKNNANINWGL
mmetsp:Transcript_16305/g.53112  ORF Transcript_16305/g.53112 Transcript_16305/m.53112 type:complete len:354 (-) Transcript_16305:289-1350(-)